VSKLQQTLFDQIRLAGLPVPKQEYRAIEGRMFRWDMAWPAANLLVEVQGGTWIGGGHSTGAGVARDTEKLNLATLDGWFQMQFTSDQIRSGKALLWLQSFFGSVKQ